MTRDIRKFRGQRWRNPDSGAPLFTRHLPFPGSRRAGYSWSRSGQAPPELLARLPLVLFIRAGSGKVNTSRVPERSDGRLPRPAAGDAPSVYATRSATTNG